MGEKKRLSPLNTYKKGWKNFSKKNKKSVDKNKLVCYNIQVGSEKPAKTYARV